jgi:hypothetical protein
LENIYISDSYFEQNPTWHTEDSLWKSQQIVKILSRNKLDICTAMDVGCGFGDIIFWLKNKYENISFEGFDIAVTAIEGARLRHKDLVFKVYNMVEDLPSADLCLLIDVIEHIDNYYDFLERIRNKAKYFIFHIPLDISVKGIWRMEFTSSWESVGHIHFFTKETAIHALEKAGFRIIDSMITNSPVEVIHNNKKKKLFSYIHRLIYPISENFAIRVLGGYSIMILVEPK